VETRKHRRRRAAVAADGHGQPAWRNVTLLTGKNADHKFAGVALRSRMKIATLYHTELMRLRCSWSLFYGIICPKYTLRSYVYYSGDRGQNMIHSLCVGRRRISDASTLREAL
jgi:hypothetical protein